MSTIHFILNKGFQLLISMKIIDFTIKTCLCDKIFPVDNCQSRSFIDSTFPHRHHVKNKTSMEIVRDARDSAGRSPTSNVARDHAILELRTDWRDGQPTRGSNWSALTRLIAYKVIKSVAILLHLSSNDSSLAIQY